MVNLLAFLTLTFNLVNTIIITIRLHAERRRTVRIQPLKSKYYIERRLVPRARAKFSQGRISVSSTSATSSGPNHESSISRPEQTHQRQERHLVDTGLCRIVSFARI